MCGTGPSVSTGTGFAIQVPGRLDALHAAQTVIVPPTGRPGQVPLDTVARKSGLRTASNLRKHFGRALHTTPQAYRRAFRVSTGQVTTGQAAAR